MRIAEGEHTVAGNQRHHPVCAAHLAVERSHGIKHIAHFQLAAAADHVLQLAGQHVEQHFGIGAGVDVAQVAAAQISLKLFGVGEVAVVRQHDAEGRIHIKWLRFSTAACVAGGGIAHMGDASVAHQVAHIARAEHIAHHAGVFMHMEHLTLGGDDARRILSAVLQHLQSVIQ